MTLQNRQQFKEFILRKLGITAIEKVVEYTGFVYLWLDYQASKYYIGSHQGNIDDGYVCSSKPMMKAYKDHSETFERVIISIISGKRSDIIDEEQQWLRKIPKEDLSNSSYNQVRLAATNQLLKSKEWSEFCSKNVKKSWKENREKRYQVSINNLHSSVSKEKSKKTILEKYGVDNVSQSEIIKKRKEQTSLLKFGKPYHTCVDEGIKQQALQLRIEKQLSCKEIANQLHLNQSSVSRWIKSAGLPALSMRKDGRKYVWHPNKCKEATI